MTVNELMEKLPLTLVGGEQGLEMEVTGAYTSDLLSDVMGNITEGNVWITLQTHKNVLAIASLRDVSAIILVKNLPPDADMLEKAKDEGIPVFITELPAFEISGKLYQLLHK